MHSSPTAFRVGYTDCAFCVKDALLVTLEVATETASFARGAFTSPTSAPFSHFSNDAKIERQAALTRTRLQSCAAERQAQ